MWLSSSCMCKSGHPPPKEHVSVETSVGRKHPVQTNPQICFAEVMPLIFAHIIFTDVPTCQELYFTLSLSSS